MAFLGYIVLITVMVMILQIFGNRNNYGKLFQAISGKDMLDGNLENNQ